MTLEDFFTLAEIKDGLTATSRVEELVSVMQRSTDSVVKNASDASRQWAAVAGTIAATKNRQCLDAFIDLDGLFYFSRWLIDAQRLGNDLTESSVEGAILALLQALENLGVDCPNLISSGIWHSVKNLDDHGSSRIQDMARKLFDSWKQDNVHDRPECNKESIHRLHQDEARVISASGESSDQIPDANTLPPRESNSERPPLGVVDEAGSSLSGSSEENKSDKVKGLEPQTDVVGSNSNVISRCSNTKTEASDGTLTDEIMNTVQESLSVKENDSTKDTSGSIGSTSLRAGTSGLLHPQHGNVGRPSDSPASSEISKDDRQIGGHELSAEDLGAAVVSVASSLVEPVALSIDTAVACTEETKKEPLLEKSLDSEEAIKQVAPIDQKSDKYDSEAFSGLSGDKKRNREDESFRVSIHGVDEVKKDGKDANSKKIVKHRNRKFSRSMTVSQRLGAIDKSTADIELGIVDALEVATKVAQEVAREVDSREPSCDSSEGLSDERTQSDSSNSMNDEQETLGTVSPLKEAPGFEKHSAQALQGGKKHLMDLEDGVPENGISSNKIELRQFSTERKPCEFDLNEEIVPDETDVVASISTLTPVVIVSRPIAAPGVPPAMVSQLERTVGWKGSAATSAFHPASPHKVSGGDLREKHVCLGIDLNVAEGEDDKVEDSTPWKQFPFSSNARSTGTLAEEKPKESSRLNLDLNCRNEKDDAPTPLELRMETRLFLNRNGHQSASPASCSSAQEAVKKVNFDLNDDGPQFLVDSSYEGPYYGRHPWSTIPHGGHKSDERVISILGAKVEVNRSDSHSTVSSFLPKGKSIDPTLDLDIARTGNSPGLAHGFSHSPSPTFGNTGQTAPSGLSFSSPLYLPGNSIPYMMDSRGAPVMPHVIGSTPHVQPAYVQQHFLMSMPGASPSLNGFPNSDRSSGVGVEGGSREILSLTQFWSRGQSRPTGEHDGASFEPSSGSSIVGGKRKEPETRWEPYTLNSRPQYPPWR